MIGLNTMLGIAFVVISIFIAITLVSQFQTAADCSTITNTTLSNACNSTFNNVGVLFSLVGVLVLLLVIPLIKVFTGGGE